MATILIIDDSTYMRSKIRNALKPEGHDFLEAESGSKALQIIQKHSPDCIILDLIIPEIDGLKILKTLHDNQMNIPVIVVTADIQETVRKQCMQLGAKAVMNKPPKDHDLRALVKNALCSQGDTNQ